jgi:hypothetical protein
VVSQYLIKTDKVVSVGTTITSIGSQLFTFFYLLTTCFNILNIIHVPGYLHVNAVSICDDKLLNIQLFALKKNKNKIPSVPTLMKCAVHAMLGLSKLLLCSNSLP